jgi:hypothetical protein
VIGSPAGVGEMLVNPQDAAVVQEPIENVWRLVGGRRNYLRMEGAVLIGDMGVKLNPGSTP